MRIQIDLTQVITWCCRLRVARGQHKPVARANSRSEISWKPLMVWRSVVCRKVDFLLENLSFIRRSYSAIGLFLFLFTFYVSRGICSISERISYLLAGPDDSMLHLRLRRAQRLGSETPSLSATAHASTSHDGREREKSWQVSTSLHGFHAHTLESGSVSSHAGEPHASGADRRGPEAANERVLPPGWEVR